MQKKQLQPKNKTKKYKLTREQEVKRARLILGCSIAAVLLIILLAVFLPRVSNNTKLRGRLIGVNEDVIQYANTVEAECKKQGIPEFSTLLLALIQQESSGQGTDIFQCSESPFNTQYENLPGSITDVNYSIQVGVETFAYCLEMAGCDSLRDTEGVKLALQEYNFGNNYAMWAVENYGGYSLESTYAFSEMMKAQLGWSTYGDPEYVDHVLQYFQW
mgnify:CR=1 FL=1